MTSPRRALPLLLAALTLGAACAVLPYVKVEQALLQGRPDDARTALAAAEKQYGNKARLLYHLDQVTTAHYAGDWSASNAALEKAKQLIDESYTKSLSSEAASFLVNDMSLPYQGENFERVLLHVLGMVNYAALGERDSALVEARRADARLKQYAQAYGPDKVAYKEDALARYLAAYLYEGGSRQDLWDAFIDYKKADEAFDLYAQLYATPKPRRLKADLQRLAEGLGEREALQKYRARDGALAYTPLHQTRKDRAELLVLLYDGLAPVKVSKAINTPVSLYDGTQQYFQMALPDFVVRANPVPQARLSTPAESVDFELFEDVNSIAVRDLKDRGVGLIAKATARALIKFQAARALQNKARESGAAAEMLAIIGTNIFAVISEQADIRSWRTLPGRIWLARASLPPGEHPVQIRLEQGGYSQVLDLGVHRLVPGAKKVLVKPVF